MLIGESRNQDFQAWCIPRMSFICSGGMDWQKSILQKDVINYFKYREFECKLTINQHKSTPNLHYIIVYVTVHNIQLYMNILYHTI